MIKSSRVQNALAARPVMIVDSGVGPVSALDSLHFIYAAQLALANANWPRTHHQYSRIGAEFVVRMPQTELAVAGDDGPSKNMRVGWCK